MSEQPIYPGARPVIGAQLPEFQALTVLATTAGHMPPLHVTASAFTPGSVQLSTQTLAAFEAWRMHLNIPVEAVRLHAYATNSWLTMDAAHRDVRLEFACHLELSPEAAVLSPAEDAERRQAALLVHRHELEDAAVPPIAVAAPAAPIAVRALADKAAPDPDFEASAAAGYVTQPDWDTAPAPAVADVPTGGAL